MRLVRPTRVLRNLLAAAGAMVAVSATAAVVSFQGTFENDDDLFKLHIDWLVPGEVMSVRSWSWAGGTNAAGEAIAEGGFAPVVTVFDEASGLPVLLAQGSAGSCIAPVDSVTGFCWDVMLSQPLPAGGYTLVLSQDGNLPGPTLSDPYSMSGNYTAIYAPPSDPDPRFYDVTGHRRDGHWALDITIPQRGAVVSQPPGWALLLAALGVLGRVRSSTSRARGALQ